MHAPGEATGPVAPRAPGGPGPMVPRPYRVVSRVQETADTVTLALVPVDDPPMRFLPGQFDMLAAFGVGEVPISFSGGHDGAVLHTVREVGAVTRALCAATPGTVLGVRGPYGTDWDLEGAEGADVVVVAGGIGLAPLRPAIEGLLARRDRYGRVAVVVGARTPDVLLFADDLHAWRSRFDVAVEVTVDVAAPGWQGDVGLVTELLPRLAVDPADTVAMVCGPEVMMRVVAEALVDRGVAPGRVRLSMERTMLCGIGHCGHCQWGPTFVCTDGPVFTLDRIADLLAVREL